MSGTPRRRVLIADDYPPLVVALERVLSPDCEVVGRVTDGSAVIDEARRLRPDVVLLDLHLRGENSLSVCEAIRRMAPSTKVIVLTGGVDPQLRPAVLAAGASAFIDKSVAPFELVAAIVGDAR